ncbi:MAG TPA: cytochrome D1 domain-containing protein [Chloroflexota bacterium]|nr:cytochrome D1 domain-containing protein [Chloroflexota bacterium]
MRFFVRHGLTLALLVLLPLGAAVVTLIVYLQTSSSRADTPQRRYSTGDLSLNLQVAPGDFGLNRFLVTVKDGQGHTVPQADVQLSALMLDMAMPTPLMHAAAVGSGRYQALGMLSMPGNWRITATVHAPGHSGGETQAWFDLQIGDAQQPVPTALPVLAGVSSAPVPTAVPAAAVRWSGLPYQALVSFLSSGAVYVPGRASLLKDSILNHSIARVPGHDEIWAMDYAGNQVAVIDAIRQRIVTTIPVGLGPVHATFSADGKRAWVTNFLSNEVSVIDVPAHRVLTTIGVGLHPHGLAISPDGRQVWVACSGAGALYVLDAHRNTILEQVPAGIQPHAVAFSPDGRTVYMTDAGAGDLVILDRAGGTVLARVHIGTGSAMVAASADGADVFVTGQSGSVVTVVDAHSRQIVHRIPVGAGPHGLAFTPDGRLLYVAVNNANRVAVIDAKTMRLAASVPVPGQADELVLWR